MLVLMSQDNDDLFSKGAYQGDARLKGSVSPSNEYPLYFSWDRKSLFSPLDVIKVLSGLKIFCFIFNHFLFSIPTAIITDSLANKHQK